MATHDHPLGLADRGKSRLETPEYPSTPIRCFLETYASFSCIEHFQPKGRSSNKLCEVLGILWSFAKRNLHPGFHTLSCVRRFQKCCAPSTPWLIPRS